jgi:hypothetical protein
MNPDIEQSIADLVRDIAENWDVTADDIKTYYPEFIWKEETLKKLGNYIWVNWDITLKQIWKYFPEILTQKTQSAASKWKPR